MVDDIDRILDETRRNVLVFYPTITVGPDARSLAWYLGLLASLSATEHGIGHGSSCARAAPRLGHDPTALSPVPAAPVSFVRECVR
jgi:hypothetical protein